MVAGAAFLVAFALTTWQSDLVIEILNAPLPGGLEPITLSPTEPFVTTLKNSAYAALLLVLPVVLYQLYAFIVPAFNPRDRRLAAPLILMVPVLFIAGAVFCYLVVLPPRSTSCSTSTPRSSTLSCARPTTTRSRHDHGRDGTRVPGAHRRAGADSPGCRVASISSAAHAATAYLRSR